jgi:hypothetical protein
MAIQTLALPQVISFPSVRAAEPITQSELALLVSLTARAKQIEKQIEDAEASIMARLRVGGRVEDGQHCASIKESSRRSVAWKEICETLAIRAFGQKKGEMYCPRVLASTKPSKSFSLQIS